MTCVSKNVYIDKLDDIVNKYSNTTIKMKLLDLKSSTYIDFIKQNNEKYPTFKIRDIVKILTYKYIFEKYCAPNWSEEVFIIEKVKNCAADLCY